ncbi:MAG TPA: hypothetical protein VMR33_01880 [Candidatus Baltobacteraceae bacterium]|jgi:hypothetical protein|nr:hypothetical protein [Candidatus Baltobacteraceae bacterium]
MDIASDFLHFDGMRQQYDDAKHRSEAVDFYLLLRHLSGFISIDKSRFGEPPNEPDFVLDHIDGRIGAELTILNPKPFPRKGFVKRGQFKVWNRETMPGATPQSFSWENASLRESLAAFTGQMNAKRSKADRWRSVFPKRWLLMRIDGGSAFADLAGAIPNTSQANENEYGDYVAKAAFGVHSICKNMNPFDYVILFTVESFLAFAASPLTPYKFPQLKGEIVERGAQVSDRFLDWTIEPTTVKNALISSNSFESPRR